MLLQASHVDHQDERIIRRMSNSPYLLTVADSILENVDRAALAEVLAAFLYFRSKPGAKEGEFLSYLLSTRLREHLTILFAASSALLAGVLVDEDLRRIVLSTVKSYVTQGQRRSA